MTDVSRRPPGCLDAEELAAFIDGRMDAAARARAEAHLAECEDCYEAMVEVTELSSFPAATSRPAVVLGRQRVWILAAAATFMVAAAGAAAYRWVLSPQARLDSAMNQLIAAVGDQRFTEARLSEPFRWGQAPAVTRGVSTKPSLAVATSALRLQDLAAEHDASPFRHAAGVALLAAGDLDGAVDNLGEATQLLPSDTAAHVDLSAALLERWRRTQSADDAARAADEIQIAATQLPNSPAVLFDRALALSAVGLVDGARRAWQTYLAIDTTSRWAQEAREHLAQLGGSPTSHGDTGSSELIDHASPDTPATMAATINTELIRWATSELAGKDYRLDRASTESAAYRLASGDAYASDVTNAAEQSAAWSANRRACLARAIIAMESSQDAFSESQYAKAANEAVNAQTDFSCSGVSTADAVLQHAWATFFSDHRRDAVAEAQSLVTTAGVHEYRHVIARAAYIKGLFDVGLGQFEQGMGEYRSALALYQAAGDNDEIAATETLIASTLGEYGDEDGEWTHFRRALLHLSPASKPRLEFMALGNAERHAMDEGRLGLASAFAAELADVLEHVRGSSQLLAVDAYGVQARLMARLGDTRGTVSAIGGARARLGGLDPTTRLQYEADMGWAEALAFEHQDPAKAIAALTPAMERIARADLPLLEARVRLIRGEANAAAGRTADATSDWEVGIRALNDERADVRDEQLRVSRTDQLWDLFANLIRARLDDPTAALAVAEQARGRAVLDSIARGATLEPIDPRTLSRWLPQDVTVLVYAALSDRLVVWKADAHGLTVSQRDITAANLDVLIRDFTKTLRSGQAPSLALSSILLPPDLEPHPDSLLAILPDGPLYHLPFAALRNPHTGHMIVDDFVPAFEPSLTILKRALETRPAAPRRALLAGYGAPRPALDLPALPGVASEIDAVAAQYERPDVLLGIDATVAHIRADVSRYNVVHLAGHALTDPLHPSRSQIFVAPGEDAESLTTQTIAALPLQRGTVVVLSACATADGRAFRGEGVASLAVPFLGAGASGVLGSLWPVSDASDFTREVHAQLARGIGLARAVALAQRRNQQGGRAIAQWSGWVTLGL